MRSVAKEADISPGLISYYYSEREDLVADVLADALPEFEAALAELSQLLESSAPGTSRATAAAAWLMGFSRQAGGLAVMFIDALMLRPTGAPLTNIVTLWARAWLRAWAAIPGLGGRIMGGYAAAELSSAATASLRTDYSLIVHEAFQRYEARLSGLKIGDAQTVWARQFTSQDFTPGRRAPDGKASTKEAILDATAEVIARDGVAAVTYRAVAERASVSLSSMTHHFDGREALMGEGIGRLFERLKSLPATSTQPAANLEETIAQIPPGSYAARDALGSPGAATRAIAEISIEASVTPALRPLAWELRRIRGLVTRSSVAKAVSPWLSVPPHDAMDFAIWRSGVVLLSSAAPAETTYSTEDAVQAWRFHFRSSSTT